MANNHRIRSNSFPSGSHSGDIKVEEKLQNLKNLTLCDATD